jgi:putative transposase
VSEAYRFIAAEKASYPVSLMSRVLGVNRTAFHRFERRPPSGRELQDAWLIEKIKEIHTKARGVYGARRIHAELRLAHGIRVGRKRVERLMREARISGLVKPKARSHDDPRAGRAGRRRPRRARLQAERA